MPRVKKDPDKSDQSVGQFPLPKIQDVSVRLVGKSPLITNRYDPEWITLVNSLNKKRQPWDFLNANWTEDVQKEVMMKSYLIEGMAGAFFPFGGIRRALASCGKFTSKPRKYTAPFLMGVIQAADQNFYCPIESTNPMGYLKAGTRNPSTGGTVVKVRPIWTDWAIPVTFRINASLIDPEELLYLLWTTGFHIGIGDWRLEKKGIYGAFEPERVLR